ncbi:class I SAM-dependent methyltransferase [Cloacibacterium caeni]|uniref:class I SAM-dependent methyltransferase n=1 Tax=Cloacibacterium caeni TaxID=2004710 RepID=UPI001BD05A70|nr:class I SAM-dependent methyltransferase [Cloacibacterium caeni]
MNTKEHWENIYQTKQLNEVSWFQQKPQTSLGFFEMFSVHNYAKIIDVGDGDSYLVDYLLELGHQDISVLDISKYALDRAKQRLGDKAKNVKWIEANAAHFQPIEKYDFWHDRATFHFLTEHEYIENYIKTANENIAVNGVLIIGTFSENGPKKCSGIDIKQYSEKSLQEAFLPYFKKINCFTTDHKTPFNTVQNFTFCSFRKK